MTSDELFATLKPTKQKSFTCYATECGLDINVSDIFCPLIKDAARCNEYGSDVFYDMKLIDASLRNYDPEEGMEPIWVGFRRCGVDSTSYVLCRAESKSIYGDLEHNYFALYSVAVRPYKRRRAGKDGRYEVLFSEYAM